MMNMLKRNNINNENINIKNKENKNSKKTINRVIGLALAFSLIMQSSIYSSGLVQDRRETVYVKLSALGKPEEAVLYVDTKLNDDLEILDNGKFKTYENLTNRVKPVQDSEGKLKWTFDKNNKVEMFAYSGTLSDDTYINIPWNISLRYKLNGVDINPNKLPHEKGLVKIEIEITPNKEADAFFRNNYMLEVTGDFDMNDFLSVSSSDAIDMMTGKNKTMMWVVLPGSSKTFELELGTNDFKFDGLTFAIVPITGKISEEIGDLVERKNKLEGAYNASMESTDIVLDGLKNMNGGLQDVVNGAKSLKSGMISMHALRSERDMSIDELKARINELTKLMDESISDVNDIKTKVEEFYTVLDDANKAVDKMEKNMDKVIDDIDSIKDLSENLPSDIRNVNDVVKTLKSTCDHGHDLIDLLARSSSGKQTLDITYKIANVKSDIGTLNALAGILAPSSPESAMQLSGAATSLNSLVNVLENQAKPLAGNADSKLPDIYNDLDDDLLGLKGDLGELSTTLTRMQHDAPVFEDTLKDSYEMIDDISTLIDIISNYSNKAATYKDDTTKSIQNIADMMGEINNTLTTSSNMLSTIKKSLDIVSNDLYNGATSTTDGLIKSTNQLLKIVNQANTFIDAKNQIDNTIRDKWNELEDESTLFNLDANAKGVSFSSKENISPSKIQILLKSPEIKEIVDLDGIDVDPERKSVNFFDRLLELIKKIIKAVTGIFIKEK